MLKTFAIGALLGAAMFATTPSYAQDSMTTFAEGATDAQMRIANGRIDAHRMRQARTRHNAGRSNTGAICANNRAMIRRGASGLKVQKLRSLCIRAGY